MDRRRKVGNFSVPTSFGSTSRSFPSSPPLQVFLLLDTAVNDRLLFDFPHNVAGLFIFSQPDKGGVPQVAIRCPLGKLYLGDQFRL
jgi:hypothetical protein